VIRPLEDGEIDALANQLAALPLLARYGRTPAFLAGDLRSAAARGDGLLVHADGGPADGLAWFLSAGTFGLGGYLRLLAIAPAAQGRGAGAALLAAFEAAVAARSRHAFLLVSDFNRPAQTFYRRHGYAEVGRLPALVVPDIDELVYWKRLAAA
jgi:ribosomal protein S18 acetylase RimI-like enzyme